MLNDSREAEVTIPDIVSIGPMLLFAPYLKGQIFYIEPSYVQGWTNKNKVIRIGKSLHFKFDSQSIDESNRYSN